MSAWLTTAPHAGMFRDASAAPLQPDTGDAALEKVAHDTTMPFDSHDHLSDDHRPSQDKPVELGAAPPSPFPDGGLKAWSVVLGAACCLFCSFGWVNCIGIFQAQYQATLLSSLPPSTVAWITSVEAALMYLSQPIHGKLYDTYGPKPLVAAGAFFHVFGLMMASLASEYYQLLLSQSVCSALGAAALFTAGLGPVGTWFLKRRALAFGIVAAGSGLCGTVLPILVVNLIPRIGYPWTLRTCAFIFLALALIALATLERRIPPQKRPWEIMAFVRPFAEPAFALNAVGLFFFSWGMFVPFNFLPLEAQHTGMGYFLANYLISILNAASVFGRIIPGWLGDKIGRFRVMVMTTLLSAIVTLALWIPAQRNAPTIAYAALFGFTSGTFVGMTPALVQQISPVQDFGVRMGSTFATISVGVLTGNPIAGALIDRGAGEYLYLKIFSGIAMLVGCVFLACAAGVQTGFRLGTKI